MNYFNYISIYESNLYYLTDDKKTDYIVDYKQFEKLVKSISKISYKQRYKYVVICKEEVYRECKKIADYFKMKAFKSRYLPEDILMVLYKEEFLGGVLSGGK